MTWSLSQITRDLGSAAPTHDAGVAGVVTDSRSVVPGSVFVALRGERFDGHDFVLEAFAKGAVAAVVEIDIPGGLCLVVPDTLTAYGRLAAAHLARVRGGMSVVAVTGSSGKTSTKDLLAAMFSAVRATVAPAGSLNNDIGLPATVLRADESTRVLVLEMGMRGLGHIARLCAVAPPDVSIVLNVGTAHIGELGSQDAIAKAKSEIVAGGREGAVSVLNIDDPRVRAMAGKARGPVLWFGTDPAADVRVWEATPVDGGTQARIAFPDGSEHRLHLSLVGAHQAMNAAAAAAAGWAVGLTPAQVVDGLAAARPASRWRMERTVRGDGLVVINDAYNANPESMAAAIAAVCAQRGAAGRVVAVLGEMLELGGFREAAHVELGALTRSAGVDLVIAVGEVAPLIARGRGPADTVCVASAEEAAHVASTHCAAADTVLVKASRGVALERVADDLLHGFGTVRT